MTRKHPFDLLLNFLHLPTKDGKPYGPELYKELVREAYILAKNTNTPYTELMNITPTERHYLLEFIKDEFERAQKIRKEQFEQFQQQGR